ncbi:uncharacterized protein CANTADRAFT_268327 [Suhomyces tanzawaensis NRRL Y-17324]|uniref:Uncharacterized protein n=1 Tax=Suhomyces tanzawaensis NRRL Y-17324 TaxID=984487 RepID=A0A1E4SG96_9ASCO|nr:uncharacterized protein CANTADRAFT_268327 [Suhomyces tanzawaensis NRRL Y-17324]ODV78533.1 hypothetical protein CANTADRAFT_268327 [Suhomyces tanzawaensis NRRL Y-17324]
MSRDQAAGAGGHRLAPGPNRKVWMMPGGCWDSAGFTSVTERHQPVRRRGDNRGVSGVGVPWGPNGRRNCREGGAGFGGFWPVVCGPSGP